MVLAWVLSVIAAGVLGFYLKWVYESIKELQKKLEDKLDVKKRDESKSTILDPDDVTQRTIQEHEEMMRRLNQ